MAHVHKQMEKENQPTVGLIAICAAAWPVCVAQLESITPQDAETIADLNFTRTARALRTINNGL